jgi:hypothetical protein
MIAAVFSVLLCSTRLCCSSYCSLCCFSPNYTTKVFDFTRHGLQINQREVKTLINFTLERRDGLHIILRGARHRGQTYTRKYGIGGGRQMFVLSNKFILLIVDFLKFILGPLIAQGYISAWVKHAYTECRNDHELGYAYSAGRFRFRFRKSAPISRRLPAGWDRRVEANYRRWLQTNRNKGTDKWRCCSHCLRKVHLKLKREVGFIKLIS